MALSEKAKSIRNAYYRDWRKKNPDRVKKHLENYWERRVQDLEKEKS